MIWKTKKKINEKKIYSKFQIVGLGTAGFLSHVNNHSCSRSEKITYEGSLLSKNSTSMSLKEQRTTMGNQDFVCTLSLISFLRVDLLSSDFRRPPFWLLTVDALGVDVSTPWTLLTTCRCYHVTDVLVAIFALFFLQKCECNPIC